MGKFIAGLVAGIMMTVFAAQIIMIDSSMEQVHLTNAEVAAARARYDANHKLR